MKKSERKKTVLFGYIFNLVSFLTPLLCIMFLVILSYTVTPDVAFIALYIFTPFLIFSGCFFIASLLIAILTKNIKIYILLLMIMIFYGLLTLLLMFDEPYILLITIFSGFAFYLFYYIKFFKSEKSNQFFKLKGAVK